jgi:hypothetical protein
MLDSKEVKLAAFRRARKQDDDAVALLAVKLLIMDICTM